MAKEGKRYFLILLAVSFFCFLFSPAIAACFLIAALFVAYFFRDPPRNFSGAANRVLSPADGRVKQIETISNPSGEIKTRILIYLSLWDVHINRAPISGKIGLIRHTNGKFFPAFHRKAASQNEQNTIEIIHQDLHLKVRQIAGTVARRIVCYLREGQEIKRGDKIGLIQFGSGVELELPQSAKILVHKGQKLSAGQSPIAELPGDFS